MGKLYKTFDRFHNSYNISYYRVKVLPFQFNPGCDPAIKQPKTFVNPLRHRKGAYDPFQ